MVGAAGFELATLCSQSRCATRLRYAPTSDILTLKQPFLDDIGKKSHWIHIQVVFFICKAVNVSGDGVATPKRRAFADHLEGLQSVSCRE